MTLALCFKCGNAKFGAWCPCDKCGTESTGDQMLDIAFSDHQMSHESIKEFGDIVRLIHEHCEKEDVCFWTFIRYVSENHSSVLKAEVPNGLEEEVGKLIEKVDLPVFEVGPGIREQFEKEKNKKGNREKLWWQFWRK